MENEHDEEKIVKDQKEEDMQAREEPVRPEEPEVRLESAAEADTLEGAPAGEESGPQEETGIATREETGLQDTSMPELEEAEWIDDGITAQPEPRHKRKHRRLIIILCIVAAAIAAGYLYAGYYFTEHYFPGTLVNGIDCSYMTADELGDAIQAGVSDYRLEIAERGGTFETLYGSTFDIHAVYGDALQDFLDGQEQFKWPVYMLGRDSLEHDAGDAVAWDEEKFIEAIYGLECMDEDRMVDPQDAEIRYSEADETYFIQPAVKGTHIDTDTFEEVIADAISGMETMVDIEEAGCYMDPGLTEDADDIVSACDKLNLMLRTDITYDMLDIGEVHIPTETINSWLVLSDDLEVSIDEEAVAEYVAGFAQNYNTADSNHSLLTTWGPTVTITTGSYGWRLNQEEEVAELLAEIEAGETVEREPVWSKKAASHGTNDYGNTYVEVNLTAQYLYFYKDGNLIVETPFVSGKMTEDRMTHEGIYSVFYMESPAVLRGEDYETPVDYWMPFNGGEGLHDATWRSSFGGTIYINNGSHGCINLPHSAAETIYENMTIGTCVIVYWLDGTSGSAQNGVSSSDEAEEEAEEETTGYTGGDDDDNQYEDLNLSQFVNE